MSEAQANDAPAPACPVPLSALPANFQKHVDPKAPVPLRMMGAKALVPMGPKEMATALYMLAFDPDTAVRETAAKSAAGLPDRILSVALRDETVEPPVLDHYADVFGAKDEYLEMLVLNASTPDAAVQRITARASERILEIVAQNQLRMLRHADIVRALVTNPATRPSTVDNVCDFCVRSGLALEDLPAFRAARRRIHGGSEQDEELAKKVAAAQHVAEEQAEAALEQMGATSPDGEEKDVAPGSAEERAQEQKKLSITQQIMKLGVAKKIEWANKKGNREVRTILLRDPNKLVQLAVIQSARITEGEIAKVALSRTAPQEVLQYIYNNRQLMKNYQIKLNLINNPKTPVGVSMRFLSTLRMAEVKAVAKNKNVPQGLATAAKKLVEKKGGLDG
ncbi:MAG TPA: hypothetical protein VE755_07290 [Myxococcales bacterium]|jgi:hypothetical protein|nr:hypothetical protein [Myxococcales bacterium]